LYDTHLLNSDLRCKYQSQLANWVTIASEPNQFVSHRAGLYSARAFSSEMDTGSREENASK
jgi:hypothetical protein